VTSIGDSAFSGCSALKEITLPKSVEEIGKCVFDECVNLKTITLLGRINKIDGAAFDVFKNLETISIPEGTESYYKEHLPHLESMLEERW
jgi:hypothetical protein